MFVVFAFKINVSIILKTIQLKYQLTKQNWPVCEPQERCCYSTGFDFKICLRTRKVTGPFKKEAPDTSPDIWKNLVTFRCYGNPGVSLPECQQVVSLLKTERNVSSLDWFVEKNYELYKRKLND